MRNMKEDVFLKGRGKEMLVGAGRPFKLKPRERLLMLLVYLLSIVHYICIVGISI